MAFSTIMLSSEAFSLIRIYVPQYRARAQNVVNVCAAGNIDSDFVFQTLDGLRDAVVNLNAWKAVPDLDLYSTDQGYPTTMTTDCSAIVSAAQACIDWVIANFPSANGYLLDYSLNADGSRTPRTFTPAQTAGFRTQLNALIGTIA